ncbi:MAG: orotidine-5'-phosphate decarboxylase [Gemmatimonadota bacterium]|nr:orotidine-5'-phosphate decarboxylase [Gemmatimonadota bacterium]|tara:strand:+ start:179 stop:880 length:702 start_codon:yes stop_codon:yes gene_type:complete
MGSVIVALDFPRGDEALSLVDDLGDAGTFYKVGLQLYTAEGPSVVQALKDRGKRVFLDLKLHDIPNTVASGVRVASQLGVDFLTLHIVGGRAMLEAARDAAGETRLLGVTVLTSLSAVDLEATWGRKNPSVEEEVGRLADLAAQYRIHGIVASPHEASSVRSRVGSEFLVVTPGIRPAGVGHDDQQRVATPSAAIAAGADYLVVGRSITRASDPEAALYSILTEVDLANSNDG